MEVATQQNLNDNGRLNTREIMDKPSSPESNLNVRVLRNRVLEKDNITNPSTPSKVSTPSKLGTPAKVTSETSKISTRTRRQLMSTKIENDISTDKQKPYVKLCTLPGEDEKTSPTTSSRVKKNDIENVKASESVLLQENVTVRRLRACRKDSLMDEVDVISSTKKSNSSSSPPAAPEKANGETLSVSKNGDDESDDVTVIENAFQLEVASTGKVASPSKSTEPQDKNESLENESSDFVSRKNNPNESIDPGKEMEFIASTGQGKEDSRKSSPEKGACRKSSPVKEACSKSSPQKKVSSHEKEESSPEKGKEVGSIESTRQGEEVSRKSSPVKEACSKSSPEKKVSSHEKEEYSPEKGKEVGSIESTRQGEEVSRKSSPVKEACSKYSPEKKVSSHEKEEYSPEKGKEVESIESTGQGEEGSRKSSPEKAACTKSSPVKEACSKSSQENEEYSKSRQEKEECSKSSPEKEEPSPEKGVSSKSICLVEICSESSGLGNESCESISEVVESSKIFGLDKEPKISIDQEKESSKSLCQDDRDQNKNTTQEIEESNDLCIELVDEILNNSLVNTSLKEGMGFDTLETIVNSPKSPSRRSFSGSPQKKDYVNTKTIPSSLPIGGNKLKASPPMVSSTTVRLGSDSGLGKREKRFTTETRLEDVAEDLTKPIQSPIKLMKLKKNSCYRMGNMSQLMKSSYESSRETADTDQLTICKKEFSLIMRSVLDEALLGLKKDVQDIRKELNDLKTLRKREKEETSKSPKKEDVEQCMTQSKRQKKLVVEQLLAQQAEVIFQDCDVKKKNPKKVSEESSIKEGDILQLTSSGSPNANKRKHVEEEEQQQQEQNIDVETKTKHKKRKRKSKHTASTTEENSIPTYVNYFSSSLPDVEQVEESKNSDDVVDSEKKAKKKKHRNRKNKNKDTDNIAENTLHLSNDLSQLCSTETVDIDVDIPKKSKKQEPKSSNEDCLNLDELQQPMNEEDKKEKKKKKKKQHSDKMDEEHHDSPKTVSSSYQIFDELDQQTLNEKKKTVSTSNQIFNAWDNQTLSEEKKKKKKQKEQISQIFSPKDVTSLNQSTLSSNLLKIKKQNLKKKVKTKSNINISHQSINSYLEDNSDLKLKKNNKNKGNMNSSFGEYTAKKDIKKFNKQTKDSYKLTPSTRLGYQDVTNIWLT